MNEYRMVEEQEIDLWDFLKSMLEQWRGCVVAGLIFMLIVPGFKYAVDMKKYNVAVAEATASADSMEQTVVVESKDLVGNSVAGTNPGVALNYYVAWKQFKDAYDNSILMGLDASDVRTLDLDYVFKCDEVGSDFVAYYYSDLASREDFLNALSLALGKEEVKAGYIAELVRVSAAGSETNDGGYLSVRIILPGEADPSVVGMAVTSYLDSVSGNTAEALGSYSLSLVSSGVTTAFDKDVVSAQANAVSNIDSWKNRFLTVYKTLSDGEKKEVDSVIASVEKGEMTYQDVRMAYSAEKKVSVNWDESVVVQNVTPTVEISLPDAPSVDKKFVALGFLLGVFAYFGGAFALLILIRRFRSGEEAEAALGLRSYGDIYEYPYHGFAAFLHDKKVYAWRHRKTSDAEQVAAAISAKAEHGSVKALTCIVLGDAGKSGMEGVDEIAKAASKAGVKTEVKKAPDGLSSLSEDEIGKFAPVLVTVVSGKTRPVQAAELLSRLKEYDIPVFGMNFIEK